MKIKIEFDRKIRSYLERHESIETVMDAYLSYTKDLEAKLTDACKHLDVYESSWASAFSPDNKTEARVFLEKIKGQG